MKYRLLEIGEVVKAGDEMKQFPCVEWSAIAEIWNVIKVEDGDLFRRPLPEVTRPTKEEFDEVSNFDVVPSVTNEEVCASEEYALSLDETETVIHPKADELRDFKVDGDHFVFNSQDKPQDDNGDAKRAELTEIGQEMGDYDVPEWNGEGLPPVGVTLECTYAVEHHSIWHEGAVEFRGIDPEGRELFGVKSEGILSIYSSTTHVRPLKSAAEVERENAIKAMIQAAPYSGSHCTRVDCSALYDAGYRLTK